MTGSGRGHTKLFTGFLVNFFAGFFGNLLLKRILDPPLSMIDALFRLQPCVHDTEADEGTSMTCLAPILGPLSASSAVRIGLEMDGVTELLDLNENLTVYQDPVFNNLSGPVQVAPGSQANISIRVSWITCTHVCMRVPVGVYNLMSFSCDYL